MTTQIRLPITTEIHAALKARAKECKIPLGTLALLLLRMGLEKGLELNLTTTRKIAS